MSTVIRTRSCVGVVLNCSYFERVGAGELRKRIAWLYGLSNLSNGLLEKEKKMPKNKIVFDVHVLKNINYAIWIKKKLQFRSEKK